MKLNENHIINKQKVGSGGGGVGVGCSSNVS